MKIKNFVLLLMAAVFSATAHAQNVRVTNDASHPVPVTGSDVTVNTTVDLSHIISVPGATPSPSPAKAMVVQGISGATPIGVSTVSASGAALAPAYSASHITTKTTTTVTSSTAYVSAIAICVTGAGTSWSIDIKNKEGTAKEIYTNASVSVGNTYITFPQPVLMTSGIDIVTGGSTAGTMDVFLTYWQ